MKKILIMKTGKTVSSMPVEVGDFEHWIMEGMALPKEEFLLTSVYLGEKLPELDTISAIIITGSPAMVTDKLDWILSSMAYLKEAVKEGVYVLGICFGHQLLAQALGGKIDFHPGGREIGTTQVSLTRAAKEDPLFKGLPECFPVNVSHMQTVLDIPESTQVLAFNNFESHHGLRFSDKAWGIQFHPEFNKQVMQMYIKERYSDIQSEQLEPDTLYTLVSDTPDSLGILKGFKNLVLCSQEN